MRAYSKAFWKNYRDLGDQERVIKNIERGEQRIKRQQDIMTALAVKLDRYRNPWQELRLQYGANKGKVYTGEQITVKCMELSKLVNERKILRVKDHFLLDKAKSTRMR